VFCTDDSGMRIATASSPHATVTSGPSQCRLAVVEGPDHALYMSDTGYISTSWAEPTGEPGCA
jgi:hypothetical protein